ncbi:MAG: ribonuclease R [Candidatus Paceibacterota bacterium]|jgi:ribonuclease R
MSKYPKSDYSKPKSHKTETLTGIIHLTSKAVGYVTTEKYPEDDIEIAPENLATALHGDEVTVGGIYKNPKGRKAGRVIGINKRAKSRFVGTLETTKGGFFLLPDDKKMYADIFVPQKSGAESGLKALVEIQNWPEKSKHPEGQIIEIIGKKGDNDTEMHSIVMERGFRIGFSPEVEAEAKLIKGQEMPISPAEIATRKDFRNTLTFTIDPADAKDFDDAVSFKNLGGGKYEIGVHIADVSHFVREGSKLDREAIKRGFSIYLVDRTIPMLPEILSNDLCSLNPKEDKLAFGAVFVIDDKARITEKWFGKTIINSDKRFTYEEAQETIDGKKTDYREELLTLNRLGKIMREEKFRKGAIDFEQDEVKFELDKTGKPIRIYKKQRLDAHKLVEEFMLLANKEVAELIYRAQENRKTEGAFLYRIHDVPDREKVADLQVFLRALGYDLPVGKGGKVSARDLQAILNQSVGKAEEAMIRGAAVRSMAKAIYSTKNIGHFGLAFEYYAHFTSPIRRYADLMVHRVLFANLTRRPLPKETWTQYEKIAETITEQEINIAGAERDSIKYKQVQFMQEQIGKEFAGVISGVTEWGIYVEEVNTRAEGMIKIRDLGDDYYNLDEKNYALVGEKTKKRFSLGDKVKFKIVGADLERKTLDFQLIK